MKRFNITVNGKAFDVQVEELAAGTAAPAAAPAPAPAPTPAPAAAPAPSPAPAAAGGVKVESPMPGSIWDVKVTPGQKVKAGDILLILEAMKMENEILAPVDGAVASVHVAKGDAVDTGTLLVSLNYSN